MTKANGVANGNGNGCFVFPAFNTNYKTRKRTFRCCRACRNKRTRCILLDLDYEKSGCDNCRASGISCDLINDEEKNVAANPSKRLKVAKPAALPSNVAAVASAAAASLPPNGRVIIESRLSSWPQECLPQGALPYGLVQQTNMGQPMAHQYPLLQFPNTAIPNDRAPAPQFGIKVENIETVAASVDVLDNKMLSSLLYMPTLDANPGPNAPPYRPPLNGATPGSMLNHMRQDANTRNQYFPPVANTGVAPTAPQSCDSRLSEGALTPSTRISEFSDSNTSSTFPHDYGIDVLRKPLKNFHFDWSNLEFVDAIIEKVDHHFLKHHFDFNTTLQRTKVTFKTFTASGRLPSVDLLDSKAVKKVPLDFGETVVKKNTARSANFLNALNLQHFKFLLCLHAFTLNTPGFFSILQLDLKCLFEIYFYKVNSIFPMVFEEEFWELYNRNKIPNIMLYAVVLNAARDELAEPILRRSFVNQTTDFSTNYIQFLNSLEMKIRQLLVFLPELGDAEKLTLLVTQVLLAHSFKYNKFGSEQSSGDITDCIGYAHSLAIHQDFFHQKIINSGAKKKSVYLRQLWWVLFIFDRFNGLLNGKAFFIRRLDFNVDRPTDNATLNKLVGLAYTLEDTSIAIYRTKRKCDKELAPIQPDKAPGDPDFNPRKIIENEFQVINDPSQSEKDAVANAIVESSHLPTISIDLYKERIVYFLERLINFWVILILRLSQIKAVNGSFDQDSFLSQLNQRIFDAFKRLRGDFGHKLVISTPVIPLVLLSAFSSPIKAQMLGQKYNKGGNSVSNSQLAESFQIAESYRKELWNFAGKWWFVKEVLNTFEQLGRQVLSSKKKEPLATHTSKIKGADRVSIGSLLSAVNDAETVLPLQLSIASPGFYEEVIVKEEDDDEVEGEDEEEDKAEPGPPSLAGDGKSQLGKDEWDSVALNALVPGESISSPMRLLLADEINFDISDMAEMVNMEMSFIPTVMDFFNVQHNFI